jgi:hypothetical protein
MLDRSLPCDQESELGRLRVRIAFFMAEHRSAGLVCCGARALFLFLLHLYEVRPRSDHRSVDLISDAPMTVIEVKPHRWGWEVFEAPRRTCVPG